MNKLFTAVNVSCHENNKTALLHPGGKW